MGRLFSRRCNVMRQLMRCFDLYNLLSHPLRIFNQLRRHRNTTIHRTWKFRNHLLRNLVYIFFQPRISIRQVRVTITWVTTWGSSQDPCRSLPRQYRRPSFLTRCAVTVARGLLSAVRARPVLLPVDTSWHSPRCKLRYRSPRQRDNVARHRAWFARARPDDVLSTVLRHHLWLRFLVEAVEQTDPANTKVIADTLSSRGSRRNYVSLSASESWRAGVFALRG